MLSKFWWFPVACAGTMMAIVGQLNAISSPLSTVADNEDLVAGKFDNAADVASSNRQESEENSDDSFRRSDPVLFEGWSEPDFVLFVSGRQHGYIEPCGCTGLENQKGGLMRRHQLMKELTDKGWNLVPVDLGNQIKRFGIQPSIKLGVTYQALCQVLGYQAIGFGPDDLKLPAMELLQNMLNGQSALNPFVSANVTISSTEFTSPYRVVNVNGRRIGITHVLGDEYVQAAQKTDVTVTTPEQALRAVWPKLAAEDCHAYVLLAFTSIENSERLAQQFPYFDVLVNQGGEGEPTMVPRQVRSGNHTTQIIQAGSKGMYVGTIGFFADSNKPIRYQRVPLDDRFEDSDDLKTLFIDYQKQLEALRLDGLSIQQVKHPSGRRFIGSESCYDCHDEEYDIWRHGIDMDPDQNGPHFRATLDLVEPTQRVFVKRHFDPECLSCHVTGWNAQNYYPYSSGYLKLEDELLHGNGCENCHGPGYEHVMAESGEVDATDEELELYRAELHVTLEEARESMCIECHDLDNSPDFHKEGAFEEYWEQIKHGPG